MAFVLFTTLLDSGMILIALSIPLIQRRVTERKSHEEDIPEVDPPCAKNPRQQIYLTSGCLQRVVTCEMMQLFGSNTDRRARAS
jgi:hypothetical protein